MECGAHPLSAGMRILVVALAAGVAGVVPTLAGTMSVPWQATAVRIGGAVLVAIAALGALTMRGRAVAVERGNLVVSHLRAPLRGASERRIPARHIADISAHRFRIDDGGPCFARYRYHVRAHLTTRASPVRLLEVRDEAEAMRIAERLRDALAATTA